MKDLLPVGSVVLLKDATKKLVIMGILQVNPLENKVYDYLAVPYPEGYIDSETMFLFFHKDVETVDYIGYVNAESQTFRIAHAKYLKEEGIISEE